MGTRVYKYGLVPIGYPPQSVVGKDGELQRANNLWNTLVALHKESRENWDDIRRAASIDYSEKMMNKSDMRMERMILLSMVKGTSLK